MIPVSIVVSDPVVIGRGSLDFSFQNRVSGYSQQIDANGGYRSAQITFAVSPAEIVEWITYGLGRDIQVFGASTIKCWEGFVNNISVGFGGLSFTRGPLMDIANRVQVKYTDFEVGQAAVTTALNDTTSQAMYGIIHKVISTGSVSPTSAEKIRATYLQENKLPASGHVLSSTSGDLNMTIECLGYGEWLKVYPYNESTDTTYTAREKVLEVLGDDPNSLFSTDYNNIESNTLSVNRLDNDYRLAQTVIDDIVSLGGDDDNNRRLFGVYDDRTCYLQEIPSVIAYTYRISDPGAGVRTESGQQVDPWTIRPGQWLQVYDFLPTLDDPTNLRDDPRCVFIENVSYTAPYEFSINGSKTGTLSQQLFKLGLGGM